MTTDVSSRRARASDRLPRVTIACPGCARERRVFEAQLESGQLLCSLCREIELLVAPDPDEWDGAGREEWRRPDELEAPRKWAARVWRCWSPSSRAEVAGSLDSLAESLRGAGPGEAARHRRAA